MASARSDRSAADAVVVQSQQLDDVADIRGVVDAAGRHLRRVTVHRVGTDPSLLPQLGAHVPREAKVGGVVSVQVADLPAVDREGELAPAAGADLDPGPRGDLLGDALAWALRV